MAGLFLENPGAIRKTPTAYSVKLPLSYVVNGIKIKITAKFRASRHLGFKDTKRIIIVPLHVASFITYLSSRYTQVIKK